MTCVACFNTDWKSRPHNTLNSVNTPPFHPRLYAVVLNKKKAAYGSGDREELRRALMTPCPPFRALSVTTGQKRRQLERLHRSAGPEGIGLKVLQTCFLQGPATPLQHKPEAEGSPASVEDVIPVPYGLNDYWPVTITSHLIKVLDSLVWATTPSPHPACGWSPQWILWNLHISFMW